jgi:glycosyltransferase involved in cell wall biosynthesis
MATRISDLLEAEPLRYEFGTAAQQRIRTTFNWDQMAEQYATLFLEIAG